ncbi:magnesium transporter NIPA-domain-containing protein [Elsinoe ampelina]|uniref:Magnesium transporter NIPA-domain-containing protein n=1 Tax=Elsinoe ampelina TaxID=302913 RepID=A0A6A6FYN9_9PEZI|nr:magnesium transporter NIPA-domain-containing protein [Elsinoe ampelina]
MDTAFAASQHLVERAGGATGETNGRPPIFKVVGIILAIASGLFIGVSFVVKKVGLLQANKKYNEEAGEGYGYLKNWMWWTGMSLMIFGEIFNFVAYAFVDAILVTPLGALSVVVTTILSAIFLKERLSFVGKIGCFQCIIGSVVIVLNAPEQSAVSKIQDMQRYVISPGFLSYAGVVIAGSIFTAVWAGPRYGKKSMLVYLSICSWVGGLSVVATQGLGAAIVTQIGGEPQFNQWFLYVLLVFVIGTLLTEIIYLNKALNLFNAALVTPTYYVYFTSATIISSAILFRGFKGTAMSITTVIMGFLVICSGVVLLQLAKSSKDVPDTAVFKGDLDQVRTIAEQEEPEYEPRADTIRGSGALLRAISQRRAHKEVEEAKTLYSESMEPIREDEAVEWDGLRRRRTVVGDSAQPGGLQRSKTIHPPLGMSKFPDENESDTGSDDVHPGFFQARFGRRSTRKSSRGGSTARHASPSPVPMAGIQVDKPEGHVDSREHIYGLPPGLRRQADGADDTAYHSPSDHIHWSNSVEDRSHGPTPPPHGARKAQPARRTFSFQQVFHRQKSDSASNRSKSPYLDASETRDDRPRSRSNSPFTNFLSPQHKDDLSRVNTEEERLGLVKGDSTSNLAKQTAYLDSSPVASPDRPLMQSHQARQERESNLRAARTRDSDEDEWHVASAPSSNGRSESPAVIGRDFGVMSASENSNTTDSPVVMSPTREEHAQRAQGGNSGRQTPRRGYQRGRYIDSDDDNDDDFGLGPVQRGRDGV